jgi:hypothetical protein
VGWAGRADGRRAGRVAAAVSAFEQVRAWQRGAEGERRTAQLLERLTRDGYVVFHDLAVPGSPASVDHLAIGPSGMFVIDSKQWSGRVYQGADGLALGATTTPLDCTPNTVGWEAEVIGRLLGIRAVALVRCMAPTSTAAAWWPMGGDRARPPAAQRARR